MINSIKALYSLNKKAKQYRNQSTTKAKNRSKALYELKHNLLLKLKHKMDKIETHYINNKKYFCFYYDKFSFHVPQEKINTNIQTKTTKVIHEFETDHIPDKNFYSEKQSLDIIQQQHNINPNTYLPNNSSFESYWSYLPNEKIIQ